MGTHQRKFYTEQFKEEAVKLAKSVGVVSAARDLGMNPSNIHRWRRKPVMAIDYKTFNLLYFKKLKKFTHP